MKMVNRAILRGEKLDDDCRKAADSQEDEERNADKQENEACFIVFP